MKLDTETSMPPRSIVKSHVTVPYVRGQGWALPGGRFTELASLAEGLATKLNDMATGRIPGCPRIIGREVCNVG